MSVWFLKFDGSAHIDILIQKQVDQLVENAYENWDSLQEVEGPVNETFQPPQGNYYFFKKKQKRKLAYLVLFELMCLESTSFFLSFFLCSLLFLLNLFN